MAFFRIEGRITSENQAEILTTMNWFATNYSNEIELAEAIGAELIFRFGLAVATYSEAIATLTALQSEFGARIQDDWSMLIVKE